MVTVSFTPPTQAVPFDHFELWIPFALDARRMNAHGDRFLRPIGRLKPGVTLARAQDEVESAAAVIRRNFSLYATARFYERLEPMHKALVAEVRPADVRVGAREDDRGEHADDQQQPEPDALGPRPQRQEWGQRRDPEHVLRRPDLVRQDERQPHQQRRRDEVRDERGCPSLPAGRRVGKPGERGA